MPPRNARSRGGAGNQHNKSSSMSTTDAESSAGTHQTKHDTHHNTDQPCCSTLTRIAHSIFPSQKSCDINNQSTAPDGKDTDLTNGSCTSSSPVVIETHHDWYTLLRGYLVLESKREDELGTNLNKKKMKKKRKKKGTATVVSESSLRSASEGFDPTTCHDDDDADENDHAGTAADQLLLENGGPQHLDTLTSSLAFQNRTDQEIVSSVDLEQRMQQERIRRINRLMNQFISSESHKTTSNESTTTTTNDSAGLNLRQLHDFIATIVDGDGSTKSECKRIPLPKRSGNDNFPPNVISRKQIEMQLQNIRCEVCRTGVERILLPNLTNPAGTTMVKHPPFRQLLLRNLIIPTIYDTIDQEQEMEQRATAYQILMEEGITPPEHTRHWSFHIQTTEQSATEPNATATPSSLVAGRPQYDVIGWELRRPILSQHQQQQHVDAVPLQSLSEPTLTDSNMGWTMSEVKFLLDHYVLLLGLPADEVLKATTMSATSALTTLTPNDYAAISSKVSGKVRSLAEKFRHLATTIEQSYQQYTQSEQFQNENKGCNTDWQTFAILKNDIDETCSVVMNELLNINIETTQAVHRVLSHIGAGIVDDTTINNSTGSGIHMNTRTDAIAETKWATTHCCVIWRVYIKGCISIISAREKYETELFQLAETRATGMCVPDMMVTPAARTLYSMFMKTKLGIVVNTMQTIERQLNASTYIGGWHSWCSTNINATFVARLYTEDLFFDSAHGWNELDHNRPEMERSFEDVLKTIREMTDTIHEQRIEVIQEKYLQQYEKLHRIVAKVNSYLDADSAPIMTSLRRELEGVQQIQLQDDANVEFIQLKSALMRAVEIWVCYRLDVLVVGVKKQPTPVMPFELRRSMLPDTTILFSEQTQQCMGGNEQHRAICVLVGLFFVTLSEKFKEWQAHIAAQELLTAIVDDHDDDKTHSTTLKPSKKQKKKVKKSSHVDEKKETRTDGTEHQVDAITDSDDELPSVEPVEATSAKDVLDVAETLSADRDKKLPRHENGEGFQLLGNEVKDIKPLINGSKITNEGDHEGTSQNTIPHEDYVTVVCTDGDVQTVSPESTDSTIVVHQKSSETIVSSGENHVDHVVVETNAVVGVAVETVTSEDKIAQYDGKTSVGVYDISLPGGFQSADDFFIGRLYQLFDSKESVIVIL